jgi:chemotaxis protein MotB
MNWRRAMVLALAAAPVLFTACGYSEEEWQAKLNENKALTDQLNSEKAAHEKAQADLKAAGEQLKRLGVDVSNLNASVADKDAALDKLRRDKAQLDEIRKRFELLKSKLESLTKLGLNVTVRNNRMTIQLPGDVLFDSGRIDLKKEGKEILLKVAEVIRNDPQLLSRSFQVAGHTDNMPLAGGPYKDNWGLSVMRAREVLSFLITPVDAKTGGGGMPAKSWSPSGYGETDPVVANDKPENKQKNRRVELVVLPNVEEMLDLKSLTK